MLPTASNNEKKNTETDDSSFVDAISNINEGNPSDDNAATRNNDLQPENADINSANNIQQDSDNDIQIAELLAPYIANLSLNNPMLYDQLIQTIDQNRMINSVLPDENSEFERIQELKRDMKDDLEADWNAVDPVQFLGEDNEEDDQKSAVDNSSSVATNGKSTFGNLLSKMGIGTSDTEDDNEDEQNDDLPSLTTNNYQDKISFANSNQKSKFSMESKPDSITEKLASAFKKTIGLEDNYNPTAHYDEFDMNDEIELDRIPTESRLSGDSIFDPHAALDENSKEPDTFAADKLKRQPGLIHKMFSKYQNTKPDTEASMRTEAQGSFLPSFQSARPKVGKAFFPKMIVPPTNLLKKMNGSAGNSAAITVHITNLLQKQRFLIRLCKALMLYGAPTHRLESYMKSTSQVLEIDGQFLYLPGCMIISFDNNSTTTNGAELHLVKCNQGVNLWKLHKVYKIYKLVIHDSISLEDASNEIDLILIEPNLYNKYIAVLLYGLASAMVTPFAFGGDWINIAISFIIGGCVGFLQYIVAPKSTMYSNVYEVTASIVVSFCARALGSIPNSNICFGAVAQGSLTMILPGYIILCGSLELQHKNLLSGSVRMVYAIIYSLFLSFGITLGAALFAWCYNNASNETTCSKNISDYYKIFLVPVFSVLLALINQAHWSQLFVMTVISCTGYVVSYFSKKHFSNSTEFCSALAAFVIGILGNLYSRVYSGLAVSAILPAIFVQVPSGIASQSSLLTGVNSANEIVNGSKTSNVIETNTGAFSFGVQMVEVAIGVSVGLFASTLIIYPLGKKKTGVFTL
ncbi:hypothetical protein QEN19_003206 [Hanseniaspora menglaensis]